MGTDIHMYIERRRSDGTWEFVLPPAAPPASERTEQRTDREGKPYSYVSPFWGPHDCMYEHQCYGPRNSDAEGCLGDACMGCLGTRVGTRWYHNRNYSVFAILTGTVRNGTGFAGVVTGSGFHGIVPEPRGMPADVTDYVREQHSWDHSEGWLTLDEILAFNWKQRSGHCGVIPLKLTPYPLHVEDYITWRAIKPTRAPRSYSGSISGRGIVTVTEAEADHLLANPEGTIEIDQEVPAGFMQTRRERLAVGVGTHEIYVRVHWGETYAESAKSFLAFVEQFLTPLGDPKDTRLVFGFDS